MSASAPIHNSELLAADITSSTTDEVVRLTRIFRSFGSTPAINDISLTVNRGEILGIIGRSGAGKSTLIRCLNGLEKPDSGSILIEGQEIVTLSESQLQPVRRRIGMIFQHFNLMSAKTVSQNIALPLKISGMPRAQRQARIDELLELVGLSDKKQHYPAQLSGGQKQRVGIARALAANPSMLLSDEATSALDPETTQSILALLKEINRRLGLTILLITHEMDVIRRIADRVIVLEHGKIVEQGPAWKILARPQATSTKKMVSTLIPTLPDELLQRLLPDTGDVAIVRIQISGDDARRPIFNEISAASGLQATLVHGSMDSVQNEPVGTLFLSLAADNPAALDRALTHLTAHSDHTEVLGYVSSNA